MLCLKYGFLTLATCDLDISSPKMKKASLWSIYHVGSNISEEATMISLQCRQILQIHLPLPKLSHRDTRKTLHYTNIDCAIAVKDTQVLTYPVCLQWTLKNPKVSEKRKIMTCLHMCRTSKSPKEVAVLISSCWILSAEAKVQQKPSK